MTLRSHPSVPGGEVHFAVYWRTAPLQLFSYKRTITARSPREAREVFRRAARRRPIVIGVKELTPCGRRAAREGRWVA